MSVVVQLHVLTPQHCVLHCARDEEGSDVQGEAASTRLLQRTHTDSITSSGIMYGVGRPIDGGFMNK